ncbi:glycosyltransferase [Cellulosimicrobium sp. NPDC057127]|uniref:glycosyltransferase n=1 Tax=Cellulosimicrobium sp. NPDC057127 TaxID=3346026 RepID=UPI00363233D4
MSDAVGRDAAYVLPLRRHTVVDEELAELAGYLRALAAELPVVVADGSPPDVRARHTVAWGAWVRVVDVPAVPPGCNGKVVGVVSGLAATSSPRVVVADDDVRYDHASLTAVLAALDHADLVVPQNVFDPLPWHARWDTARSLLNRAVVGHDYAGTVALRRAALRDAGYDDHELFENLELERTVAARGGVVAHRPDLVVVRRPPDARRFVEQRVRQAYDSLAQPSRLVVELALAPLLAAAALASARPGAARRCGAVVLVGLLGGAVLLAEAGRRRAGGAAHFPSTAALWAPAWVLERAVCAWAALAWWALGGVPYAGTRLRRAAHSVRELRRETSPTTTEVAP